MANVWISGDASADPDSPLPRDITPISLLDLSDSIKRKLDEAGFKVVADIGDWTASGHYLTDIKGIGNAAAEKIVDALNKHWASAANDLIADAVRETEIERDEAKAVAKAQSAELPFAEQPGTPIAELGIDSGIRSKLARIGIHEIEELEEFLDARPLHELQVEADLIDSHAENLLDELGEYRSRNPRRNMVCGPILAAVPVWQDTDISDLGLHTKTLAELSFHDLRTVGQIVSLGIEKLSRFTGIDEVMLVEIENQLGAFWLTLTSDQQAEFDAMVEAAVGDEAPLPTAPAKSRSKSTNNAKGAASPPRGRAAGAHA